MNLKTDIEIDLKGFFQWWRRELLSCLPETLRQKLTDKTIYILLSVVGDTVKFEQLKNGQQEELGILALDDTTLDKYQQLIIDKPELEKAVFILRLTSEQAIQKTLYLPAAAKENLRQVVGFEMDRVTPFTAQQVYYAVKILAKEQQGKIKVQLVLTPKNILDGLYQQLKIADISPIVADYSGAANDFEQGVNPYNLLPEKYRPVKNKTTQIAVWGLSCLAFILLAAVLVFPLWLQNQQLDSLTTQLKSLKKDTQLVQAYQLEIDQIVEQTEGLINIKNKAPSLIETINLLSKLLPNETWLTHFKYNNQKIQIQGQSPTASALISVIEASPLFSNARFVSPLTQDKKTGMERFQISMDVNSKGDTENE